MREIPGSHLASELWEGLASRENFQRNKPTVPNKRNVNTPIISRSPVSPLKPPGKSGAFDLPPPRHYHSYVQLARSILNRGSFCPFPIGSGGPSTINWNDAVSSMQSDIVLDCQLRCECDDIQWVNWVDMGSEMCPPTSRDASSPCSEVALEHRAFG